MKPLALCVALNPAIDQTIEVAGLRQGEVNRASRASQEAGGKGVNVASCLADHGVAVAVTGLLGRDNPVLFENLFNSKGITDDCLRIDGQTRINTKLIDPARSETTDINLPGPQLAPTQIAARTQEILGLIEARVGTLRWLVLSGSLPPGWPADSYARLIRHARALGIRTLLDTSGAAFGAALKAGPAIVKPNRDELSTHLGRPLGGRDDSEAAARELLATQAALEMVVVSMGHEGALFVSRDATIMAQPLPVAPQSTVGAGDAMVAGILAAQLESLPLTDCARLSTAFAAGKLERLGPHLPAPERIRELARQVRLDARGRDQTAQA